MKPFLEELAEKIVSQHERLDELTIVFPNQRAALFFRQYLARHLTRPVWSPKLMTIEELFADLSDLQEADRLSLVFKLYSVYQDVVGRQETFDRFYFWGEMLLRDFDEVDKYLVAADLLFRDLSTWRELDSSFDDLTDEQKKFLRDFWANVEGKPSGSKEEFLSVWRTLPRVYAAFRKLLRKEGIGYEGMIHRDVAEGIRSTAIERKKKDKKLTHLFRENRGAVIFAGFNALTRAEEILMSYFVTAGAEVVWDLDSYYVDDDRQEAGQFFRSYRKHPVLGATFTAPLPTWFKSPEKKICLYGVPQKVGQAKLIGELLEKELRGGTAGDNLEVRTVIVLPDEAMLMPMLYSLPANVASINVTMGYPLRHTPLYTLLELLLELQLNRKEDRFSHRQVNAILAHAYTMALDEANAYALRQSIIHENKVFIPARELQVGESILPRIFRAIDPTGIPAYLLEVVQTLGASFGEHQRVDREYAFHFHRQLSRLHEVLTNSGSGLDIRGFQKLFRQVIQSLKIPFTGEPLKGLQIMGVLETRNLDFDNVFILSLNEGSLPASPRQGSYIPYSIRKAYGLPFHEHQDAMYAYLFYRVLQRAKKITLFYNTEPDILGMGEMSRFVQQLIHESGWKIESYTLNNPPQLTDVEPVEVLKTPRVMKMLRQYADPRSPGISPSKLNDYVECSLRFYLKYIANLQEAKEVKEDIDAAIFGTFLHNVMDWFYSDLIARKQSKEVSPDDLTPAVVGKLLDPLIDRAFRKHYGLPAGKEVEYKGQGIVVRSIVRHFALRLLEVDREYAPFSIEMLEEKKFTRPFALNSNGEKLSIMLGGRIDRVDRKNGAARVLDYKTGKDEISFDSIASLFARVGKRNKAAFQTILYAWLYQSRAGGDPIQPLLMTRKNLFKEGVRPLQMNRRDITDIRPHLPEFEDQLRALLEELYNPAILFTQTREEQNCKFCLFKDMCRR
jgi:hypothetical protein